MAYSKRHKPQLNRLLEKQQIYNPPFAYFASVSMTLLSIVQGIAFTGMIGSAISAIANQADLKIIEYLLATCFILGLWHRYVQHHQFAGWQITIIDTLILFAFGVVEGIMVAALAGQLPVFYVNLGIALGFLVGTLAYWHASNRLRDSYIEKVYREHYGDLFDDVYPGILGYEIRMRDKTVLFTGAFVVLAGFAFLIPAFSSWFSVIEILLFVWYLLHWDLNVWLLDEIRWKELCQFGLRYTSRNDNDAKNPQSAG